MRVLLGASHQRDLKGPGHFQCMPYRELLTAFNESEVRYVIVGGLALNLHGVPRATADLDLAVALEDENLAALVKIFKKLGWTPRIPLPIDEFSKPSNLLKWKEEKGMLACTFRNPQLSYEEVDIIVEPVVPFAELEQEEIIVRAGGMDLPIASIDHIIALKEASPRAQDRWDVEALRRIKALEAKEGGTGE